MVVEGRRKTRSRPCRDRRFCPNEREETRNEEIFGIHVVRLDFLRAAPTLTGQWLTNLLSRNILGNQSPTASLLTCTVSKVVRSVSYPVAARDCNVRQDPQKRQLQTANHQHTVLYCTYSFHEATNYCTAYHTIYTKHTLSCNETINKHLHERSAPLPCRPCGPWSTFIGS